MFTMGLQQYTQGKVLPEPNCGANMNALLTEIIAKHATKSSIEIEPLLNEEHDSLLDDLDDVEERVLSELRYHLGTVPDFCYPSFDKNTKGKQNSMNCPSCAASTTRK